MQDRLAELQMGAPKPAPDVEMGETGGAQSAFMTEFFHEVGTIKATMSIIRRNIKQIEQKHNQALTAIGIEEGKSSNVELEKLMDETNMSAQDVRNRLKTMDKTNKEFAQKQGLHTSEAKIRSNMHGTLTRKFVDLMSEYQEIQTKYKNKYRERVERQYKIVQPNASEEEVKAVVEGQNDAIFASQIFAGPGHAAAKNALADIQERHRDIVKLEQSIAELHQLFIDMSILVESQGELLDQIEYTVNQSVNFTSKAVGELEDAKRYQTKARKKMCCLIVICLVIIIVIFSSVFGSGALSGS